MDQYIRDDHRLQLQRQPHGTEHVITRKQQPHVRSRTHNNNNRCRNYQCYPYYVRCVSLLIILLFVYVISFISDQNNVSYHRNAILVVAAIPMTSSSSSNMKQQQRTMKRQQMSKPNEKNNSSKMKTTFVNPNDYYAALGCTNFFRKCTIRDIKTKYRKLALQYHPDKFILDDTTNHENDTKQYAAEQMMIINQAYSVLSNTIKRNIYNEYGYSGIQAYERGYDPSTPNFNRRHGPKMSSTTMWEMFIKCGNDLFESSREEFWKGLFPQLVAILQLLVAMLFYLFCAGCAGYMVILSKRHEKYLWVLFYMRYIFCCIPLIHFMNYWYNISNLQYFSPIIRILSSIIVLFCMIYDPIVKEQLIQPEYHPTVDTILIPWVVPIKYLTIGIVFLNIGTQRRNSGLPPEMSLSSIREMLFDFGKLFWIDLWETYWNSSYPIFQQRYLPLLCTIGILLFCAYCRGTIIKKVSEQNERYPWIFVYIRDICFPMIPIFMIIILLYNLPPFQSISPILRMILSIIMTLCMVYDRIVKPKLIHYGYETIDTKIIPWVNRINYVTLCIITSYFLDNHTKSRK